MNRTTLIILAACLVGCGDVSLPSTSDSALPPQNDAGRPDSELGQDVSVGVDATGGSDASGSDASTTAFPSLAWRHTVNGGSADSGRTIATDASGAVYATAWTADLAVVGGPAGGNGSFVTKLANDGQPLWTNYIETEYPSCFVNGTAVVGATVFVAGGCIGPAQFGAYSLQDPGAAYMHGFLAELNAATGQFIGLTVIPSAFEVEPRSLLAADGALYLGGYYGGTAEFGATQLVATTGGVREFFVARYDVASSSWTWAVTSQTTGHGLDTTNVAYAQAIDGDDLYIGGKFGQTVTLGGVTHQAEGPFTVSDAITAKLSASTGAIAWVRADTSEAHVSVSGIDVVDGMVLRRLTVSQPSSGQYQRTLNRLDPLTGASMWSEQPMDGYRSGRIFSDGQGGLLSFGTFEAGDAPGGQALVNAGGKDIVLVRLNASGLFNEVVMTMGGPGDDSIWTAIKDAQGRFVVSGEYGAPFVFDGAAFVMGGQSDAFVVAIE